MADPCRICGWAGGGPLDPPLVYWLGWIGTVGKLALPIPPQSLRPRCAPGLYMCAFMCIYINYVYFVCVCLCVFMCTSDPWPEIAAHNRREGDRLEPIIPREGAA